MSRGVKPSSDTGGFELCFPKFRDRSMCPRRTMFHSFSESLITADGRNATLSGARARTHSPVKHARLFITVKERENNRTYIFLKITAGEYTFGEQKRGCRALSV